MAIFKGRLRCFYCGQRSEEKKSATVREFRCNKCEAVNYLDENGDITDPPVSVTNATNATTDMDQPPFRVPDFDQAGLFCRKCIRNQHLLMNSLATFLPDIDDPEYPVFEEDLPRYQKTMEERYPQVCENCELRVQNRIRETKYEAKSDHLRRIMERSKASRATKSARNRNWRHIVDVLGFLVYWASVAGQVLSDLLGAVEAGDVILKLFPSPSLVPLMSHASQILSWIGYSSQDTATVALIAGVLSIWWNPRLHYKVEGVSGRILGLNQYYECQLIVMAARFGVWALLQDPSRLKPSLPPTLHAVMIVFTCLATLASHKLIQYDTRPLVLWSETPTVSPSVSQRHQPLQDKPDNIFPRQLFDRFPVERLGVPKEKLNQDAIQQPAVPDVEIEDSMDWTPSISHDIHPKFVTNPKPNVVAPQEPVPSPFFGSLPQQPRPPAWDLRNPIVQKPPPPVPEVNPFHRPLAVGQETGGIYENTGLGTNDVNFARPKFFPPSDYTAMTGLEGLFDHTFTFKPPGERTPQLSKNSISSSENPFLSPDLKVRHRPSRHRPENWSFPFTFIRLVCLLTCLVMWAIDWLELAHIPRDWVLMGALVISILFTGFGLLECLNKPPLRSRRVVYSVTKFVGTLYLAVHLGSHFSGGRFYQGGYLELSVKVLSGLLAVEESLGLLSMYHRTRSRQHNTIAMMDTVMETRSVNQSAGNSGPPASEPSKTKSPAKRTSANKTPVKRMTATNQLPPASASPRSFSSTFSSTRQEPANNGHNLRRLGVYYDDLKDDGSDVSEAASSDSDADTVGTSDTNQKIRNSYPFIEHSPIRGQGLGSGIRGLRLDDGDITPRRMTRSQAARGTGTTTGLFDANGQYQTRKR